MSGYFYGGTLVYQGTILVDTSLTEMARYLKLPSGRKGGVHRDLAGRLITVAEFLGHKPKPGDIEDALAAGLSHSLCRSGVQERPSVEEITLAEEWHRTEFWLESFVDGVTPKAEDMTTMGRSGREPSDVSPHRVQSP